MLAHFDFARINRVIHDADEEIVGAQDLPDLFFITFDVEVIETMNDALGNVYEVRVSGITRDRFPYFEGGFVPCHFQKSKSPREL